MGATRAELPVEFNLMRIVAHGLVPATTAPSPTEVVRRMLATQGQLTSSIPHSLLPRAQNARGSDVAEAFEARELVRFWPFRGTLHIATSADYHWLRALRANNAWFARAARDLDLKKSQVQRAREVAQAALAEGQQTRRSMRELWLSSGVADHLPQAQRSRLIYILFTQFHQDGTFVSGPLRGNEHLLVDVGTLPADITGWAQRITDGDPVARQEALVEVARRYAISHGPVSAADLARWTGFGIRDSREALSAASLAATESTSVNPGVPAFGQDGDARVVAAHAVGSTLAPGAAEGKGTTYFLRHDLWDLMEESRRDACRTMYLSMFDELHVGYQNRSCLTDEHGEKLICPGGNGMFRPLVVSNGRLVAVNPKRGGLTWMREPSSSLRDSAAKAIATMSARLSH